MLFNAVSSVNVPGRVPKLCLYCATWRDTEGFGAVFAIRFKFSKNQVIRGESW
jgi:hypothetical protein